MTQAELTWVPGSAPRWFTRHKTVAHPGTNRAQRRVTTIDRDQHSTIKPNKLQQLAANNTSCISITIELHQQQVTYKLALLTHKVWTTATNVSQWAGTDPYTTSGSALIRCSAAGPLHFFCCCSIHLELSTCWHSTVRKHAHYQTPPENPSVQTHLVLLCCIKRLCIFKPNYYYYYYYY